MEKGPQGSPRSHEEHEGRHGGEDRASHECHESDTNGTKDDVSAARLTGLVGRATMERVGEYLYRERTTNARKESCHGA
jgi:hypothetical protein